MRIARDIVIDVHIDDVFAFVADARNDPSWCAKVSSVEQIEGGRQGPGATYEVVHRPIPFRPAHRMTYTCVEWDPPWRILWREDDGDDVIHVTYQLESVWNSTRLTQLDDAELHTPRLLQPIMCAGIGRDIAHQLRSLKRLLERR